MKINTFWFTLIVVAFMLTASAVLYDQLPEQVPSHWRNEGAFHLGAIKQQPKDHENHYLRQQSE